jgi:hypothetical protein
MIGPLIICVAATLLHWFTEVTERRFGGGHDNIVKWLVTIVVVVTIVLAFVFAGMPKVSDLPLLISAAFAVAIFWIRPIFRWKRWRQTKKKGE